MFLFLQNTFFAADLFGLNGCAQVIVVSSCCCILTDGVKVISVTIKFWPGLETESCALFIWLDAMATLPAFLLRTQDYFASNLRNLMI